MTASQAARGRPLTRAEVARVGQDVVPMGTGRGREERGRSANRDRRPRRRVGLVLPTGVGVEVRLPALPLVRLASRLASSLLLAAVLLGLQQALMKDRFVVARAEVAGTRVLGESKVRSMAQVDGKSIFYVDPTDVARRLESYPEIAHAEVAVRWPNRVEIALQERHPMVEWNDAGRVWWISSDGVAYLKRGDWPALVRVVSAERVLDIGNTASASAIDPEVLRLAGALAARLPQAPVLAYDRARGFGYQDSRGWVAYFGKDGDMLMKVTVYFAIVDRLLAEKRTPALISVEDPSVPYYRLGR